jgi:hypothetical protein
MVVILFEFLMIYNSNVFLNRAKKIKTEQNYDNIHVSYEHGKAMVNWREKNKVLQEKGAMKSSLLVNKIEGVIESFEFEKGSINKFNYEAVLKLRIDSNTIIPFYLNKHDIKVIKYYNKKEEIPLNTLKPKTKVIIETVTDLIVDKYDIDSSTIKFKITKK